MLTIFEVIIKQCSRCIFFFNSLSMLFLNLFNSCIKPTRYDFLQDVLLKCLTLVFSRVYSDIKSTNQRNENIMILGVFPRGGPWIPPSAWRKTRDLMSSSDNLSVDVMIWAIPKYHPICALLNQFCSSLSTSTSISLRLNSSDLLPASLETFSTEDIFIYSSF